MKPQKLKDARAPNARWLTPYLTVVDAAKTIDFYQKVFGFVVHKKKEENGKIIHVEMFYHKKLVVMFCNEDTFGVPNKAPITTGTDMPSSLYLYVDDVDITVKKLKAAGGAVQVEPQDAFWGDRFAAVKDIDGYSWGLGTHIGVHVHHQGCCDHG